MDELTFFYRFLWGWGALAVVIFVLLFFIPVPYGRFTRRGWGPVVSSKIGWLIMESPSSLVIALWFFLGIQSVSVVSVVFFLLWEAHYLHRAFIYPLMLRGKADRMPVMIAGFAFLFNTINSTLNGSHLFLLSGRYSVDWLWDPRFLVGLVLFIAGFIINRQSDEILRKLRLPGDSGYKIPTGGLFRWVSSPNYFGEIVEWMGWAVLTWSPAALTFALWSIANLTPRAGANHRWYREQFPDYPKKRKALIPFLW